MHDPDSFSPPGYVDNTNADLGVPDPLFDVLQSINWNYGRGHLERAKLETETSGFCTVTFTVAGRNGRRIALEDPEYPRFRIRGDKVTFRGHTRKIQEEV